MKLKRLGLSRITYKIIKRNFNKCYFKIINNEEKAYWLGFICADGCIVDKNGQKRLKITLKRGDKIILEKFIESIEGDFQVKDKITKLNGKIFEISEVNFNSKQMVIDLQQYITPNKTDTLEMPNIRKDLIRHFLRGFSDGDGSFYCGNKSNRKAFEITGNSPKMLYKIQEIFMENNIKNQVYKVKNGNLKLGIYSFEGLKILHEYFYKDCKIFLERKYKKSQEIINLASYLETNKIIKKENR